MMELREIVARAMCTSRRHDPDYVRPNDGRRMWQLFEDEADAVIDALFNAGCLRDE